MNIPITEELRSICKEILAKKLTIDEWCLIESDDMFQSEHFEGGFDATEMEFTFSYLADNEYWFQMTIEKVNKIALGGETILEGRLADR